jgi:predicted permease
MTFQDLKLRVRALFARGRTERELTDELAFHLERETLKHIDGGMSPADAQARARARFGSISVAAEECRDARGTALVDNSIRDALFALRMFRRAPLAALTIVATVALGLGLVAVVFTFFNVFAFRVDRVPDPHELFAVVRPTGFDEREGFTYSQYEALRRETNVFSDVFAMLPDIDSRIDGRMMGGTLVTGNFFQAVGVSAALGRTLTPADDQRSAPRPVMVLSHKGWSRLFANDPAAIGRSLLVNGSPYVIVGVMPEDFRGLGVSAPDYWAPLALLGQFRPIHKGREDFVSLGVVGRLKPGMSRNTALAGLIVWDSGRRPATASERSRPSLALEARNGTIPSLEGLLLLFTPLFFAFGLILLIGCANVANLLLARSVSRQREIGVRLSLGASRGRIVRQLLTESMLLALMAAVLGFIVSRIVLEGTVYAVTNTMAPEIAELVRVNAPAADWRVIVFLITGAMVSTVFFGLAPALQATRVAPARAVRGELSNDPRPGRARNLLIGVQVTASALLLICSAIFLRSALAASTANPGMRTSDTLMIEIINEPFRDAMVTAVAAEPMVTAMAASWPDATGRPRAAFARPSAASNEARSSVGYQFVSPEYFEVLGIDVVRGRGFAPAERTASAAVALVSQTVAQQLWPNAEAVGQVLQLEPDPASESRAANENLLTARTVTVVGVVRDIAGVRIPDFNENPGVYLPASAAMAETSLIVRVKGDPDEARRTLLQRLTTIDPNMGQVITMRTMAGMQAYLLQLAFWLTVVLGGLALALTLSGLFSVLSYLVEQRAKEIGLRMALGATPRTVGTLVVSQLARPVAIGLIVGTVMAGGAAIVLMSSPAASTIGTVVHVLDPVAYTASLAIIVSACALSVLVPALRAARIDPMRTLRQE